MDIDITDDGKSASITAWLDQALGGPAWRTLDLGADKPAEAAKPVEVEMEAG